METMPMPAVHEGCRRFFDASVRGEECHHPEHTLHPKRNIEYALVRTLIDGVFHVLPIDETMRPKPCAPPIAGRPRTHLAVSKPAHTSSRKRGRPRRRDAQTVAGWRSTCPTARNSARPAPRASAAVALALARGARSV
jgi:hypothetical protein